MLGRSWPSVALNLSRNVVWVEDNPSWLDVEAKTNGCTTHQGSDKDKAMVLTSCELDVFFGRRWPTFGFLLAPLDAKQSQEGPQDPPKMDKQHP